MKVWANVAIWEDLDWAGKKVMESNGMLLLKLLSWETSACTCTLSTLHCFTCPIGIRRTLAEKKILPDFA